MESVILERQQIIAEAIRKILNNFKKDSASRKTVTYLNKRLESLEELWGEFKQNHDKLLGLDIKKTDYYISNSYEKVRLEYESTRDILQAWNPVETEEKGALSKADELISQQNTNFRAFSRAVRGIHLDDLKEQWEIEDKLAVLQSRWKAVDNLHWQIDNLLIGSDINYEQEYTQNENIFETTKRELNRKLNSTSHQFKAVPQIEIPIFSGNYSQWPTFMDLYLEAIHNNPSLTKAQKMQHLKGKLRGEAERIVQHLNITNDNYDICWEILNHRYNNLQLLFTKQMRTFMSQPSIQKNNAYEIKRLHDTSLESINAIFNLGVDTSTWDPILVHILTEKMDPETYTSYMEFRKSPRELPSFAELIGFLEGKFTALESANRKMKPTTTTTKQPQVQVKEFSNKQLPNQFSKFKQFTPKAFHMTTSRNCPLCKMNHILIYCKEFQAMSAENKLRSITENNICANCMYCHSGKHCNSTKRCRVCNNSHHTTLHDVINTQSLPKTMSTSTPSTSSKPTGSNTSHNANHVSGKKEILLATVEMYVKASDGSMMRMRALLDQGSQINLITESAAQRLGLPRQKQNAAVSGIGIKSQQSKGTINLECHSCYGDYVFHTQALVMPKMVNNLPNYTFEPQEWPHLQNIKLADTKYNVSRSVDILLDAGVYSQIIMDRILRGPLEAPLAQETKLGWVLLGNIQTFNCYAVINNIDELSRFWESEEILEHSTTLTPEEEYCEKFYQSTTQRNADGRYQVRIPMKPNFEKNLGLSKPQAIAQFKQLEKRFAKNEELSVSYKEFIHDYIHLQHMKECLSPREPSCFLPHHGVLKSESSTTKLRVVFNGSNKTKSGSSLNELMECGPKLQQDLQEMLLRWRKYQYVYTADIEKFYRQIMVQDIDQHLQKIVWRESEGDVIKEYQLCTITYGTKAAPFLAMRTIKQLIKDDGPQYPLAAELLNNQLYVDDFLGGDNKICDALVIRNQLIDLLRGGGFNLRKFASNDQRLIQDLPQHLLSQKVLNFKDAETNKTLGVTWNPRMDHFTFQLKLNTDDNNKIHTKRSLLSDLSKIYDPLGWLAPITAKAKIIFQQAWAMNTTWDEPLPHNIQKEWDSFKRELHHINNITISRWLGNTEKSFELHGFCDASEKAYSSVVYCKTTDNNGQQIVRIVTAKTKLAPLNKLITLPRLELCAALLLSRLIKKIIDSLNYQSGQTKIFSWTDSMVVLGWLQGDVSRWKTYVANRVTKILEILPIECWHHVKSNDNAADCASRGLMPSQLISFNLWWEGPKWLSEKNIEPQPMIYDVTEDIKRPKQICATQMSSQIIEELLQRHSSITGAVRALCWISRFINKIRGKTITNTYEPTLSTSEINNARIAFIKLVQSKHFEKEIAQLKLTGMINKKSRILNLSPFLDNNGILRVGGRLEQSRLLTSTQKHPTILPSKDRFTDLIVHQAHLNTLHGGPRLTLSHIRDKYWIIQGMRTVKGHTMKCIKCHRFKSTSNHQLMANLPSTRITPSRPFLHTGVDFTGQVEVKANKGRGIKTTKGYIALFVCLSTKAIHLELVSDLSSPTFIAALKRFCSRRGTPQHIYSDNGTNFVGAARLLQQQCREALQHYVTPELMTELANSNIEWHFNAPAWPTAGGLWEAGVKSTKHHLRRVLGEQKLTFEEFSTLLAQIEACLNSRPLTPITENIEDLDVLTPGHFLVGGPVLSSPLCPDIESPTLRQRWLLIEKLHKDFWRRWSKDYLQALQSRTKWTTPTENLRTGDMVLIKEDNIPPAKWLLGRVTHTHPGADGLVRVVTVKTRNSELKRPITKLSRLPLEQSTDTDNSTHSDDINTLCTEPRQRRAVRNTKSFYAGLPMLLLLIASCVVPTKQELLNVTKLNPARLIYFDKVADMHIVQEEWKMIVFYNMSSYWQSQLDIERYISHLSDLCQKETTYSAFVTISIQLQHELAELKHYNIVLQTEHGKRIKRGLINGVGYIANSLFGVLDDRFAEKYNQDIKLLQNNQDHLLRLYKQHTSIIEGEYNLIRRNEQVMNKQFQLINQHLKQTEEAIHADNQNAMYITATALAATTIISNLRRTQHLLLDLVTDVQHGRIDTHLLQPEAFENQLNIIARKLPVGLALPCTDDYACVREMYRISRVHVKLTEEFLIFEVKIPLLANEQQYELTRIVPIKYIKQKTMTSIIPTTEYMAINMRKSYFIPLTSDDMTSCIHINSHSSLICNLMKPLYNLKTNTDICEINIINNEAPAGCRTKISSCTDEWIQLHGRDTWLFACCQECTMRIFCPAGDTSQTLRHNGIVTLPPGCMLQGEYHLMYSHHNFRSEVWVNDEELYTPMSGINQFIKDNNNFTFTTESHEEQFRSLHSKIENIKTQQENLNSQADSSDNHRYIMYIFIAILCSIIMIWVTVKITKQYRHKRTHNIRETIEMSNLGQRDGDEETDCQEVVTNINSKSLWRSKELPDTGDSSSTQDKATSPTFH